MGVELCGDCLGDLQYSPGARTCGFAYAEQDWWRDMFDMEKLFLP